MILSRSLLGAASAAMARLTADRRILPNRSVVLVVEHRDDFFGSLASDLKSEGFRVERAASADSAHRLRGTIPDLILANCELPDESGWLMVSKWCLTRTPKRVWLYQAWPAAFDQDWVELTKVEQILYYGESVCTLADQIREQLVLERGRT